jgi:hypothetical protein
VPPLIRIALLGFTCLRMQPSAAFSVAVCQIHGLAVLGEP